MRPLPANGFARIWQKPMIEVLAYAPEELTVPPPPISEALEEFRQQLHDIKQKVELRSHGGKEVASVSPAFNNLDVSTPIFPENEELNGGQWRVGTVLQKAGLLPVHVQKVLDQLHTQYGPIPPGKMGEEIGLARAVLASLWRKSTAIAPNSTHLLIGPAGSGKTTCLCKWLTQSALVDGRMARVWRLDGATANMAESLSVYCEILGVPVGRCWQPGSELLREDVGFIDLPGVDWRKPEAIRELGNRIEQLGAPTVHLVLNGAYDISILLAQQRAFANLPINDLIITHLDEESRWGKVWNLALGTNYSIRYFSTGQNIPGDFCEASPEILFARQFPGK
ncbi:MAG TPA: hypothetical protein VGO67_23940 [Verrucomicrobiae bacterium]